MKKLFLIILSLFLTTSALALELQITIPTEIEADTIEAFAQLYHYQNKIEGKPNPETKEEFTLRKIAQFPKEVYMAHENKEAEAVKKARELLAKNNAEKIKILKLEDSEQIEKLVTSLAEKADKLNDEELKTELEQVGLDPIKYQNKVRDLIRRRLNQQ